MATDTELAWLAGAFDGEGCVGLYPRTVKGKRSGWDYYVIITNCDERFIHKAASIIADVTGLQPYIRCDTRKFGGRRLCYHVVLTSKSRIVAFLRSMRPHLVVKGEQADLMIRAIQRKGNDAYGTDTAFLYYASEQIKALKEPSHADAEVTLQGLRSGEHRNDEAVIPKYNLPTSAQLLFWDDQAADDIV